MALNESGLHAGSLFAFETECPEGMGTVNAPKRGTGFLKAEGTFPSLVPFTVFSLDLGLYSVVGMKNLAEIRVSLQHPSIPF